MVLRCCSYGCKESNVKNPSLSFHSFPKDSDRRKLWTMNLRRKNFIPSDFSKLCSKHFTEDCFDREKFGGRWLKSTAVPTIFDFASHLQPKSKARKPNKKRSPSTLDISAKEQKLNEVDDFSTTLNEASPKQLEKKKRLRYIDLMDDDLIISFVKEHPFLYNTRIKEYKNKEKKEYTWSRIAVTLGYDVSVLKNRWKVLRDRFVRRLRQSDSEELFSKFPHYAQMSFLTNIVSHRTSGKQTVSSEECESIFFQDGSCDKEFVTYAESEDSEPAAKFKKSYSDEEELQALNVEKVFLHRRSNDDVSDRYSESEPPAKFKENYSDEEEEIQSLNVKKVFLHRLSSDNVTNKYSECVKNEPPPEKENSSDVSFLSYVDLTENSLNKSPSLNESQSISDDVHFLLSLRTSLSQVSNDKKICLKGEILNLIQDYLE